MKNLQQHKIKLMYTLMHKATRDLISDTKEISSKNKEKIQEAIDSYHNAKNFPRKKKKAIRNQALNDYHFWTILDVDFDMKFKMN